MGGAFGAAIGGAVMAHQLDGRLLDRLGATRLAELGGAGGVIRSPRVVGDFPDELRMAVIDSVSDSLGALVWRALPVMVVVLLLGLAVREIPLRTSSSIGGQDARSDRG